MKYEESKTQIAFVEWIRLQYPKLFPFIIHIPNGGKMGVIRGAILKKMGVKAGVADILFMYSNANNYHGLWIEFKSSKGVQSESQKEFEKLCQIAQYDYHVVNSVNKAIDIFKKYMDLK
jgi:hypothetical protein